ncbi:hypothetical protein [Clostridium sp. YIM B02551]|uniref:hypothetical protein n=1 Tax=Clostridium sp. YIM B02551 TaxID=2910679 RepID=UPI001EEC7970|nr:hypothetical protein [Clostridium sp. YIM B02551]
MELINLEKLITVYKTDDNSSYNSWFINNKIRLNAITDIRTEVTSVVESIKNNTFGNDFKCSPLELVLNRITEQKQVLKVLLMLSIGNLRSAHLIFMKTKKIRRFSENFLRPVYMLIILMKLSKK